MSEKGFNMLAKALEIAIRTHINQVDKQNEPYLLHILRVVESVKSKRAKTLAALHDVVEDGNISYSEIENIFQKHGMMIANSVEVLTRCPQRETYNEYIENIKDGYSSTWTNEIREVKIADLKDNLNRIPPEPYMEIPFSLKYDNRVRKWSESKRRYEKALQQLES